MARRKPASIAANKPLTDMLAEIQRRKMPQQVSYAVIILEMIARQYPDVYQVVVLNSEETNDDHA